MIFVVDDEQVIQVTVKEALHIADYEAETFQGGYQVLKAFRTRHEEVEAVVLDLGLPGMSGRDVFRELRSINPNLPVLLITGYVQHEDLEFCSKLNGNSALLQKPFSIENLLSELGKLTENANDAKTTC